MKKTPFTLSLIVPCYNEERTIEDCLSQIIDIAKNKSFMLEVIVVDDASNDNSLSLIENFVEKHASKEKNGRVRIRVLKHEINRGKGAALRTGLLHVNGDFVGIQDADAEYNPKDYLVMLEPFFTNNADVVYGSRYLRSDTRRVLYFWHTWMNKALTCISNMFTNLDITDMETCYKLFRREVIQQIAPTLKEERFGFEPEITAKIAQGNYNVYECAISYNPRSYEEGKRIGWKTGIRALYCIFHYGAHKAPLPMQLLIYFCIGVISMSINILCFYMLIYAKFSLALGVGGAFIISAAINYLLCTLLLFRHKARWNAIGEIFVYFLCAIVMGCLDYGITLGFFVFTGNTILAKFWASVISFFGTFFVLRWMVFPEQTKKKQRKLK